MKFYNILADSLTYPLYNIKRTLYIGLLSFIPILLVIILVFLSQGNDFIISIAILSFSVASCFILGYCVRITHNSIHGLDAPNFYPKWDLYEGVKFLFLLIFYFMIPVVIGSVLLLVSGFLSNGYDIGNLISEIILTFWSSNFILDDLLVFITNYQSPVVVLFILFLFFSVFLFIGIARYCDDFNLIRGVDLGSIINTIGVMSWDFILLYVSTVVIVFGLSFVFSFLLNDLLGGIIYLFLFQPYIILFIFRTVGLMQRKFKEDNAEAIKNAKVYSE